MQILDPVQENGAARGGHALAAQDDLHPMLRQQVKTLGGRPRRQNVIAILVQQALQGGQCPGVVVHQQQRLERQRRPLRPAPASVFLHAEIFPVRATAAAG